MNGIVLFVISMNWINGQYYVIWLCAMVDNNSHKPISYVCMSMEKNAIPKENEQHCVFQWDWASKREKSVFVCFYNNINKSLTSNTYQIIIWVRRQTNEEASFCRCICVSNRTKYIELATVEVAKKNFVRWLNIRQWGNWRWMFILRPNTDTDSVIQ